MTTYYVGPGGKDSNDGLTWESRKLTLAAIEQVVESGDGVFVAPLTDATGWKADTSGESGRLITYEMESSLGG